MDTIWLTYDELADRLGIERESARQHVKRKRWARQPGNDGKVRIGVPEEALSARCEPDTSRETDPVHEPEQSLDQPLPHDLGVTTVLTRHIERLEQQLEVALNRVSDRDAIASARDLLVMQVEALRAALTVAEKDRDRWHETATRTSEPVLWRPWWRRLTG